MADNSVTRANPSGEIVKRLSPAGQVNSSTISALRGQSQGWKVWVGKTNTTSTAEANVSFQNPESGPIVARTSYAVVTAGTGTIDIGIGTAGAGSGQEYFDGATLTAGLHSRFTFAGTAAASATIGQVDLGAQVIAANGEANDSIVARVTDGVASTAEAYVVVEYIDLVTG